MTDIRIQTSEVAILSMILKNPILMDNAETLGSHMFSSTPHQRLYEIIKSLHSRGLIPDVGMVSSELSSRGILNLCGGDSYLTYLSQQEFDENNFDEFLEHVISSFKARELMSIVNSVPNKIIDITSIDSVLDWIRDSINALAIGAGDKVITIEDATKEMWNVLKDRVDNPKEDIVSTSIGDLDSVTGGYRAGDLWVIAGRPGMGKSSYICNSVLTGTPSLIFSLEMSSESLMHRIVAIDSGVPVFNMRMGTLTQGQLNNIADSIKNVKELPIYIDTNFSADIDYVTATIRKYKKLFDIRVVYVDYIQLLVDRSVTSTHDLGRVSRELKLLSNDLGITSIICSQLNRSVEAREDKRPMLHDLRQSGNLEEDADIVVFLYRDELYNKDTRDKNSLELILRKQRNGPIGTLYSRFYELTNKIESK